MRSLKLCLPQLSCMTDNPINLPKCLTDHRKAKSYLFVYKQLLDEVFVIP